MKTLVKAALLSLGLAATAAVAQAQSISSLPPEAGEPGQTARTTPYGSTQSFYPKPGGSEVLTDQNSQPPAPSAVNQPGQPYSTGPKTN
jgi:hypothetical protein